MKKKSVSPTPAPAVAMIAAEKLAQLCNLTPRRLYQLANENKIPPPINGSFPMLATITSLFAFYQRDGEEIQKEKLKKLTAERQMTELKLSRQRGLLMEAADAERQAAEAMAMVFDELQRRDNSLPPVLAGLPAVEIFKRLHADTEAIRQRLTEKFQKIGT